ncbi:MAG TPA: FAD-dependent oxidoreductase [Kofleriaceae bacterium]|nr:FAD-dependent oxidoreductase [Kofleriaceae bacterium]
MICSHMSEATLGRVIGDDVVYRPDLVRRPAALARAALARLAPSALALHERDRERLATIAGDARCPVIVYGDRSAAPLVDALRQRAQVIHVVQEDAIEDAEHEAIVVAERLSLSVARSTVPCAPTHADGRAAGDADDPICSCADDRAGDRVSARVSARPSGDVVLVGAGIVNLVTALELVDQGHRVSVHDRMVDPLAGEQDPDALGPRSEIGATFGGEDARIFSFNEARHHLARSAEHAPGARLPFRHAIGDDGWLSRPLEALDDDDRAWIDAQEALPPWLAREYNADIVAFNVRSFAGWHRIFAEHPQLVRGTGYVSRLVRVYQTPAGFARARLAEAEIGALLGELPLDELAAAEPALARAIGSGAIAGALRVHGFSLQVKTLARNLVRVLGARGVAFHWGSALEEVSCDGDGRIASAVLGGRRVEAASFVLSPGALGASLRTRVASLAPVGAMAGMWLVLPNDEPRLTTPLKIGRRAFASAAAAEGANVIPGRNEAGRPVLFCSAGHGFVGLHPGAVAHADLAELSRCILETAHELFPDKVASASGRRPPSFCVRPWTPSGLGIFSARETARGGRFIVTSGHNTGGFSQAPEIAAAVARALEGTHHDMHALYAVGRGEGGGGRAA